MNISEEIEILEQEYQRDYPGAESPFKWGVCVSFEEALEMMRNRSGRKINLLTEDGQLDGGEMVYV